MSSFAFVNSLRSLIFWWWWNFYLYWWCWYLNHADKRLRKNVSNNFYSSALHICIIPTFRSFLISTGSGITCPASIWVTRFPWLIFGSGYFISVRTVTVLSGVTTVRYLFLRSVFARIIVCRLARFIGFTWRWAIIICHKFARGTIISFAINRYLNRLFIMWIAVVLADR